MPERALVLASGSPRRRELLSRLGVPFVVEAAEVDEGYEGPAREAVLALARRKAGAVAARRPGDVVLAADTLVECGDILGKPASPADARRMLRMLAGNWHQVHTGVCVMGRGVPRAEVETTRVRFVALTEEDIARYVATGESMDKAGGYAIQGMAGMFIDRIEGCPHNVMGLPLALTRRLLFL